MLSRTKTHGDEIHFAIVGIRESIVCNMKSDLPQFIDHLLRYLLPIGLAPVGLWLDDLYEERAHRFLELPVVVGIVWAIVPPTEPCRFSVWDLAELAWL